MDTVYAVIVGEYEDTIIVGIFSTKESAENAIFEIGSSYKWYVESDYRIREFPLDNTVLDRYKSLRERYPERYSQQN